MAIRIFQVLHTRKAPPIYPTPDPDAFAAKILRNLSTLDASAEIGSFQLADPNLPSQGFYKISNQVLVFNKQIYMSDMGQSLGFSGNVHPSKINGTNEEIFFLNVTATYNCLDIENTLFNKRVGEKGEIGVDHGVGIKRPAFFPKLIGDSKIFRLPQMRYSIFVASDGTGTEDDFYSLYQSSGIEGLRFEEVWNDVDLSNT